MQASVPPPQAASSGCPRKRRNAPDSRPSGRDPEKLRIFAPVFTATPLDDLKRYREAGITDFYLVLTGQTPMDEAGLNTLMLEMGHRFVDAVASW